MDYLVLCGMLLGAILGPALFFLYQRASDKTVARLMAGKPLISVKTVVIMGLITLTTAIIVFSRI